MTRIAQVLAGGARGGAENFFVRLVQGLHRSGEMQQQAFIRSHPQRISALEQAGVTTAGFRFGGPLHILDRHLFRRALNRYEPDIVMTWMNRAAIATRPGPYSLITRLGNYYDLKYHRHCDYWIGISRGICDYLVQGGMPANRVFHIPNFADESQTDPLPRDSFATATEAPLIVSAGRLHRDKGFDTLLQAMTRLPDTILWLAGSGPEEKTLRQLTQDLNLSERVRFLGWRNDVPALMRTADLFVCPSRHEGLGSIVLESWAHGCPIVATASQGPGELIEHGATGLLAPIDDPVKLAAAIGELLEAPGERERMAQMAAARYRRDFSEKVIVDQYNALFSDVPMRPRKR